MRYVEPYIQGGEVRLVKEEEKDCFRWDVLASVDGRPKKGIALRAKP